MNSSFFNSNADRKRIKSSGSVIDVPKLGGEIKPPRSTTPSDISDFSSPRKQNKTPASFPGLPAPPLVKPVSVAPGANFANAIRKAGGDVPGYSRNSPSPMPNLSWRISQTDELTQELSDVTLENMTPNSHSENHSNQQNHQSPQQNNHQQILQTPHFEPLQLDDGKCQNVNVGCAESKNVSTVLVWSPALPLSE
jgi:hypothetical protein